MVLIDTNPNPPGPGVNERQLHEATGLRTKHLTATISTNISGIGGGTIGTAGGTGSDGTWSTGLRAASATWNSAMPVPMTPTIFVFGTPTAIPGSITVRFRVRGYDQFGMPAIEVTPFVTKSVTTTSFFTALTLSRVFSFVEDVEVMTQGVNVASSSVTIGWHTAIDPTGAAAAAFTLTPIASAFQTAITALNVAATVTNVDMANTWQNWGIGTPVRLAPYGKDNPFPTPEIMGAMGLLLRQKNMPTVLNIAARLPVRGQLASGVAPVTGVCVGRSLTGWQGDPHKFGFFSSDNWTTKISGITLTGSDTRASDVPTSTAQFGEDDMQFTAMIRTTDGTRRGEGRVYGYPNG